MAAGKHDIIIDQGSDFALNLTVKDDGIARDLTGYSARAELRPKKQSNSLTGTFTCTIDTPASGGISMLMDNATTAGISAGHYYYDLEIFTAGDAIVTRLLEGQAQVTAEVTR